MDGSMSIQFFFKHIYVSLQYKSKTSSYGKKGINYIESLILAKNHGAFKAHQKRTNIQNGTKEKHIFSLYA